MKNGQRSKGTPNTRRFRHSSVPAGERRLITRMMWWWLSLIVFVVALGLIFPSFVIVYAVTSGWDATGQYMGLVIAGAGQGFLLAVGQIIALRRGPLRVPILRWIVVTTTASALAWLLGLIPGSVLRPDWGNPSVLFGVIALILLVIVIVPIAQWTMLRPLVRDAWRWIIIASIAFSLAVGIFLSGLFLNRGATHVVTTMLTFSVMGWLGVLAYTLLTGLGVAWMAREAISPSGSPATTPRKQSAARATVKAVASRAGAKVAPAAKKVGAKVAPAAKKVGSRVVTVAKKVAAKASSVTKTSASAKTSNKVGSNTRSRVGGKTSAKTSTAVTNATTSATTQSSENTKKNPPLKTNTSSPKSTKKS